MDLETTYSDWITYGFPNNTRFDLAGSELQRRSEK
ncbi:hypothetical protein FHS27_006418 [Rhodopirellula rubra]|uniref:Uncharacterized protein n=1 Tax=Aporhodopirellula rubra TaxID=980271 RepID=A0A7W5E5G4_9BACT|nr:hypothetical protein [Aporhodopirellula rubra]